MLTSIDSGRFPTGMVLVLVSCGCFGRRDSFITHRAFCDALAEESAKAQPQPPAQDPRQTLPSPVPEKPDLEPDSKAQTTASPLPSPPTSAMQPVTTELSSILADPPPPVAAVAAGNIRLWLVFQFPCHLIQGIKIKSFFVHI